MTAPRTVLTKAITRSRRQLTVVLIPSHEAQMKPLSPAPFWILGIGWPVTRPLGTQPNSLITFPNPGPAPMACATEVPRHRDIKEMA